MSTSPNGSRIEIILKNNQSKDQPVEGTQLYGLGQSSKIYFKGLSDKVGMHTLKGCLENAIIFTSNKQCSFNHISSVLLI
jgi:hypothetical protein